MFSSLFKDLLRKINAAAPPGEAAQVPTGASVQSAIEKFLPTAGNPLALAFGIHIVAGQLAYDKFFPGDGLLGPSHKFVIWNGDGMGLGWDSALRVAWAGKPLALSPDGNTPGYHFHPGTFTKVNMSDDGGPQGQDSFLLNPLTFSGTCNTVVLLPENLSVEQQPDKLRGVYKCMRMPIFNESGAWLDRGTATQYKYSHNPADIDAFGFWRAGLTSRINWPSWWRFRNYCKEQITWDDGSGPRLIDRFVGMPVWTKPVGLAELLDTMGLITGTTWQDDGREVRWILPNDLTPLHHFTTRNTAPDSFRAIEANLRQRVNRLIINTRDIETDWLRPVRIPIEREELWTLYGENVQEIALPNMTQSQATRIGEMIMRLATDNPNKCTIEGYGDSFRLLEGDTATATIPENGWRDQLVRVNTVTDLAAQSRPDVRRFELQRIDGKLYDDADHVAKQPVIEPE